MGDYHQPIMTREVVQFLKPPSAGYVVDCTVGGGGHAEALLEAYPGIQLIGLDRDEEAVGVTTKRLQRFGERTRIIHSDYRRLSHVLRDLNLDSLSGLLFDLGVSSHQLDSPQRGFSYGHSGPLDMRMDAQQSLTAADLVNSMDEKELENIIRTYGEERWARRIARFIVRTREEKPIVTTDELVGVIKAAIPASRRRQGPHPARRTFQALRIAVNAELDDLEKVLNEGINWLKPGARIVVLSFHSLEDRRVKQVFRHRRGHCQCPPHLPVCVCEIKSDVRILTPRPLQAGDREQEENPRSRSAKLRAAERISDQAGF